nr:MAG TPA: hypothetical protein [Caudoviricetes sp.]
MFSRVCCVAPALECGRLHPPRAYRLLIVRNVTGIEKQEGGGK